MSPLLPRVLILSSFQLGQPLGDVWVRRTLTPRTRLTEHTSLSFAVLMGPIAHIKHLLSRERLPFSAAYITSLALTIYFSVSVSNFP